MFPIFFLPPSFHLSHRVFGITSTAKNLSAQCKNLCAPAKTSTRSPLTPQRFLTYHMRSFPFQFFKNSDTDHLSNTPNPKSTEPLRAMQKPLRACKNLYAQAGYPTEVLKLPMEIRSTFQESRQTERPFIKYFKGRLLRRNHKPVLSCKNISRAWRKSFFVEKCFQFSSLLLVFTCLIESLGYKSADWEHHKYFKPQPPRTSSRNEKTSARLQKPLRADRLPHRGSQTTSQMRSALFQFLRILQIFQKLRTSARKLRTSALLQKPLCVFTLKFPIGKKLWPKKTYARPGKLRVLKEETMDRRPREVWDCRSSGDLGLVCGVQKIHYRWLKPRTLPSPFITCLKDRIWYMAADRDHSSNARNLEKQEPLHALQKPLRACKNLYAQSAYPTEVHKPPIDSFSSSFQESTETDHSSKTLLHSCKNLYVCSGFPSRGDWNSNMVFSVAVFKN